MLTHREILSVLEMLRNENLDVRTVTLGVSLLDCASDNLKRLKTNIYDRITRIAQRLVSICDNVGEKYGIPVVNKRISVSPIAVAAINSRFMMRLLSGANGRGHFGAFFVRVHWFFQGVR